MMTDDELFWAARRRAPHNGASSPEVARLRSFTHAEFLADRIAGATQDEIGRLLDAVEEHEFLQVGDYIGHNAKDIAWNVVEVICDEGTAWRRAFGEDRFVREDDGALNDLQEYDWITEGGHCTTDGLLFYKPLLVTRVVRKPGLEADR